jgi:TMEM175 potassium channel family protein
VADTVHERERDLDRLITFIDAVVAIAITLLVLPLVDLVPELRTDSSVADLLSGHRAELGGFLLSFAVISSLWFSQHAVMSSVIAQSTAVSRLLMLWTLTVVILPFPTALVAEEGSQPATKVFYVGTMALSSLCIALIAEVVGRDRSLRETDQAPDPLHAWLTTAGFAVALGLTLVVPDLSYWPLLVLLPAGPATRLWRRVLPRPAVVGG